MACPAAFAQQGAYPPPSFEGEPVIPKDPAGHVQLNWSAPADGPAVVRYHVQMATDESFSDGELLYRGDQTGSFMSGLPDGKYYFRVRYMGEGYEDSEQWSPWSATKRMTVEHHPMWKAWALFGAGGVMMALIASFVVFSTRIERALVDGEPGGSRD